MEFLYHYVLIYYFVNILCHMKLNNYDLLNVFYDIFDCGIELTCESKVTASC